MFEDTGRTTEHAPVHVFAELSRSLWPAPSSHRWHCQGQKSTLRSPGDMVNAESSTEDHSSTLSAQAHQAEQQFESMSGAPSRWLGSPHSLSCESGTAVNECGRGPVIPDVWCYARGVTTRVTPGHCTGNYRSLQKSIIASSASDPNPTSKAKTWTCGRCDRSI